MGFLCIWEWVELPSVHMEALRREDRLCVAETFYPVRSSNDGLTIQRNEVDVFIHVRWNNVWGHFSNVKTLPFHSSDESLLLSMI